MEKIRQQQIRQWVESYFDWDELGNPINVHCFTREFELIVRGLKPQTLPDDLTTPHFDLLSTQEQFEAKHFFLSIYNKLPQKTQKRIVSTFKERVGSLSFDKRLKHEAENDPLLAAALAKIYLAGWPCLKQNKKEAVRLLEGAFNEEFAAQFLLARNQLMSREDCEEVLDDLCQIDYLPAIEYRDMRESYAQDLAQERFQSTISDEFRQREEQIRSLRPKAEVGDINSQVALGAALLDRRQDNIDLHCVDPESTQQDLDEARRWLIAASEKDSFAKFHLARTLSRESTERLRLLEEVICCQDKLGVCELALLPLVDDFYLNCDSKFFAPDKGVALLRKGVGEFVLVSAEAALRLGMWLEANQPINEQSPGELVSLYELGKECSTFADFRLAMLKLSHGNSPENVEYAHSLLKGIQERVSANSRDELVRQTARIAYEYGWGFPNWMVTQKLFDQLESSGYRHAPDYPLHAEDLSRLFEINPRHKEAVEHYGFRSQTAIGAVLALSYQHDLDESRLLELWCDKTSPHEHYAAGRLYLAGRFGDIRLKEAISHFNQAIRLGEGLLKNKDISRREREAINRTILRSHQWRADAEMRAKKSEIESAKKDMLSFLSHTLTNSFSGTLRTLIAVAGMVENARTDPDLPSPSERLLGLAANFTLTDRLIESFKLYASDPHALRNAWLNEKKGDEYIAKAIAQAVRQALVRFFFHTSHAGDLERLWPNVDETIPIQLFIQHALAFDLERKEGADSFLLWVGNNIPFLKLDLRNIDSARCARGGTRHVVVFSLISELLVNALKYSSEGEPIHLRVTHSEAMLEIECRNAVNERSRLSIRGGRKGMSFMRNICGLVGATFDQPEDNDSHYRVRTVLPMS